MKYVGFALCLVPLAAACVYAWRTNTMRSFLVGAGLGLCYVGGFALIAADNGWLR